MKAVVVSIVGSIAGAMAFAVVGFLFGQAMTLKRFISAFVVFLIFNGLKSLKQHRYDK